MPVKIFFCYAREDEELLKKLKTHLIPLRREGLIDIWHDRDISAGTEWEQEIDKHLNTDDIILLLISPDFIASDYCYCIEMQQAVKRHEQGEACVIPVILRPTYWQAAPFSKLQALPLDAIPVTSPQWTSPDEAFLNIVRGIQKAINELTKDTEEPSQLRKPRNENKIPESNITKGFVLIVDDSAGARKTVEVTLRREGYNFSSVSDGRQALDFLKEHQPDLILLDLGMPRMEGLEFIKRLRKIGNNIPIIILSAADNSYIVKGLKLGADGYIKKPFTSQDVIPVVEELMGKKKLE